MCDASALKGMHLTDWEEPGIEVKNRVLLVKFKKKKKKKPKIPQSVKEIESKTSKDTKTKILESVI